MASRHTGILDSHRWSVTIESRGSNDASGTMLSFQDSRSERMAIDPQTIRSEAHTEVGTVLQRDAGVILDRWSRRAAQEQPQAKRVHQEALLDHIPTFLQTLGKTLAASGNG